MLHPSLIEARLGELDFKVSRWFKSEINELQHILMDHEKIVVLVCGRYFGSFALLVATDQRLLLIDKRVFFMTVEDTRYDMIAEIDFNSQVYSATATIFTMNKTHKFTSVKYKRQLRDLTTYVQRRVMEIRQQSPQQASDLMQPALNYTNATTQQSRPARVFQQSYQAPSTNALPQQQPTHQTDYYHSGQQAVHPTFKAHLGHVAHLVGTAATRAAHNSPPHTTGYRMPSPYSQGSFVSRRPIVTPNSNY
ncbi:PH domain-containing protein [Candidatus Saccharibacteria bacterium]|nr:PH domain-containing protein [Candidatus Saccharibacteria bacterium]